MRIIFVLAGLLGMLLSLGNAAGQTVDLELVLAVDVSASVDANEAALQREGYIRALADPAVVRAIRSGPGGRIAVIYVEWAGEFYQHVVVDWRVISDRASADEFAGDLADQPITSAPSTSISGVMDFSRRQIASNRFAGRRAVIDVSGDGQNLSGRPVRGARDDAVAAGIIINGLPILVFLENPDGSGPATGLRDYYEQNVIGGPGAFVIEAREFGSFAETLVEKLVREIRGNVAISLVRRDRF